LTAAPSQRAERPGFGETLSAAAEALGLHLSIEQSGKLLDFVSLLDRWNRTYNLTAVRDPAEMLTHHVIDCLAAVPALRRTLPGPKRVLDVGSGGVLPGIVWAVVEPVLDVTCVDSVGKKAAFIQQAALALHLDNLHAEHVRVEKLQAAPFDVLTSRAFASLSGLPLGMPTWLMYTGASNCCSKRVMSGNRASGWSKMK